MDDAEGLSSDEEAQRRPDLSTESQVWSRSTKKKKRGNSTATAIAVDGEGTTELTRSRTREASARGKEEASARGKEEASSKKETCDGEEATIKTEVLEATTELCPHCETWAKKLINHRGRHTHTKQPSIQLYSPPQARQPRISSSPPDESGSPPPTSSDDGSGSTTN